jgi:ferredoxin
LTVSVLEKTAPGAADGPSPDSGYPGVVPRLSLPQSGVAVEVAKGTRLVDAIRAAGLPIATACGDELVCAKCGVRILAGRVARESALERRAKARNRVPKDLRLACALRVQADLTVEADYW